jgi:hypothetical protein
LAAIKISAKIQAKKIHPQSYKNMKKIFIIALIALISSCSSSFLDAETKANAKNSGASGRINASENNNREVFKEIDE